MKAIRVILIAGLLVLSTGCGITIVKARIKLPARTAELQTAKKIFVSSIGGPRGGAVARELKEKITEGGLHTLVASPSQANVVVSGEALPDNYTNDLEKREVVKCVKEDKKGKCLAKAKIPQYRLLEQCTVQIHGNASENGAALFDRTFSASEKAEGIREKDKPESQRNRICQESYAEAIDEFVWFVTPAWSIVGLTFYDVDDTAGRTAQAVDMVKASNLDKAHSLFEQVISDKTLDAEHQAWARYNLARLLWAKARFKECVDQINQAENVLGSEDLLIQVKTSCQEYTL